jgi:hypothetical protein
VGVECNSHWRQRTTLEVSGELELRQRRAEFDVPEAVVGSRRATS